MTTETGPERDTPESVMALLDRLRQRAKQEREIAENSKAALALLQPELDRFNAEPREPTNVYVVRLALDHRNSATKDAAFADDLEQAADALARLAAAEKDNDNGN